MTKYKVVEKQNHLAVYGLFDRKERAEKHLAEIIPEYCKLGYFVDKTLTPEDFEIVEVK